MQDLAKLCDPCSNVKWYKLTFDTFKDMTLVYCRRAKTESFTSKIYQKYSDKENPNTLRDLNVYNMYKFLRTIG